jgi:hypothetical protein
MQGNRLSPRQVFRRSTRRGHLAAVRLVLAAEASAIAAPDPISAAAWEALAEQIGHLAARSRACGHPHERAQ